jgi:hypothetical protein
LAAWSLLARGGRQRIAGNNEKNEKHPVKQYLRAGVRAIIVLAAAAAAVWYGLVWLLVNRAD